MPHMRSLFIQLAVATTKKKDWAMFQMQEPNEAYQEKDIELYMIFKWLDGKASLNEFHSLKSDAAWQRKWIERIDKFVLRIVQANVIKLCSNQSMIDLVLIQTSQ